MGMPFYPLVLGPGHRFPGKSGLGEGAPCPDLWLTHGTGMWNVCSASRVAPGEGVAAEWCLPLPHAKGQGMVCFVD